MIFISVNTPTKQKGLGAGKASDLKWVEASARQVAKYSSGHTIVVEREYITSQNSRSNNYYFEIIKKSNSLKAQKATFDVLSNPEFLSEGTAIKDLENPDRVLIGEKQ